VSAAPTEERSPTAPPDPSGSGALAPLDPRLLVALLGAVFFVIVLRIAWVGDDAYITFRTVDNFVNGYGPRWNPGERVQTYTHPLWMLLVTAGYALCRNVFLVTIALSLALSTAAVFLVGLRIARSWGAGLAAVTLLTLSKAFVDYSTSGLENPLTHFLLALFLCAWFGAPRRRLLWLALLAALLMTNRMDLGLLVLPAVVVAWWRERSWRATRIVALGLVPFVAWEVFAFLYYGFFFPNTAYAKLSTGVPAGQLAAQGIHYLVDSLVRDPLTLLCVALAVGSVWLARDGRRRAAPLAAGLVLYLYYVVRVGGDFMTGRMLSAGFLVAVGILADGVLPRLRGAHLAVTMVVVGFLSWNSARNHLKAESSGALRSARLVDDERSFWQGSSLYKIDRRPGLDFNLKGDDEEGRFARTQGVVRFGTVGKFGFGAGPGLWVTDELGITDPLLARLPATLAPGWRIGHFVRHVPEGYLETLKEGTDEFKDEKLAEFNRKLRTITKERVFSRVRLRAMWELHTGKLDKLIDWEKYRYPFPEKKLEEVSTRQEKGAVCPKNLMLKQGEGLTVTLPAPSRSRRLELALGANGIYLVTYAHGRREVMQEVVPPVLTKSVPGLSVFEVAVPAEAVRQGYSRIVVTPLRGRTSFCLGHLRLLPGKPPPIPIGPGPVTKVK
jgi:arabinofuranosyltransferase